MATSCRTPDCHRPPLRGRTICGYHRSKLSYEAARAKRGTDRQRAPRGSGQTMGGYAAVHRALIGARGKPSDHVCRCGAPAAEWAYVHGSPGELIDTSRKYPRAYSQDLSAYVPMCRPCHRRDDWHRTREG